MPIRRSIHAYRSATPFEQAAWTLAAVPVAVLVPVMLRWMIASIAEAGRGQAGYPAAATRLAVDATAALVQWIGLAILGGLGMGCVAMAVAYLRGPRRSAGIPGWAIAETYAVGAAAALAGLLWLA